MNSIHSILPNSAMQHGMQAHFEKYKVLQAWPKAAEAFVKNSCLVSQAIRFEDGLLTVACLSKQSAKDIGCMSDAICGAINSLLAERLVKEIIIEA